MSGNGRKHSSKWDSRDQHEFAPDSVASSNSSKWSYLERNDKLKSRMGFSFKEPFPEGRGSNKDDITSKDYRALDATSAQDTDRSYSMEMSPGLEDWKSKKYSQSPRNGCSQSVRNARSRSRSRSPSRGFRWDSGVNDRCRMRAGGLAQPCRDFAAGKCRRGSQCHFLHHDDQNYDDNWESRHRKDGTPRYSTLHESGDYSRTSGRSKETCINYAKGRCRMGASCKYVHHDNSDQFSKFSVDEATREREIDRRRTENTLEQGGRHGPNHNGDIPCKFFAFGNCRNGKRCRFSHDRQASRSPNRILNDDRSRSNQGEDQALDRPKLSDKVSPNGRLRDDRWGLDGSMADRDEVWDGSKQNDLVVVPDLVKLVKDNKTGIMGTPEPGFMAWPIIDGWDHSLDKNRVHGGSPFSSDKKEEANCWTAKNDSANIHSSQSVAADIWPGNEKMSPDWNYGVGSSSHTKEEHGKSKQQVAPGQGFNQNVNTLHSSSCHAVGQSQVAVSIVPPRLGTVEVMQNQEVSTEKKYMVEPNIMDANLSQVGSRNPPTQNMVSKEQLTHLTSLSASLAHILGTGRQLPQLYVTSISQDAKDTPFLSKTEGFGKPASITFIKPDPAVELQKQCDPMCDSMEPNKANVNGVPTTLSPSKKVPSLLPKVGQHFDDSKTAFSEEQLVKSEHSIQLQKVENIEVNKENNEVVAEEKQSSRIENKITEENGPLENMDQNSGPDDEAKKIKDVKGIRAFKFSLVEFVKELLKPTWKEGQITKEDYKAIVKKVTDKVTGTVQRVHIPQTQEKIDRYLSFSKPKLNKLIQAYVEKVQKA
ncbi:zinc finger CCCH domain-containing protein 38-like isoform X3 [Abrus precatorius]|uniref:Zinc finger CCCH domain-containing protein 38-like isoform X3 n=3 Tax=Abrus precatorius TaxID=3816 RepID=A0A8B8KC88_ABRPR|nr:zinc finger CCCH domain-containing protein 38-like isoform X3 [Abrus precatorius]XP_027341390.1 zinc finger CCCH domain-containing protein 38-like isoform X3 [Abrus precatorius]